VVNRSKALATGFYQFIGVLVLGVLIAFLSCGMAAAAFFLNRMPREKRYHADNSLPWNDLLIARPQNGKMWEVLGWNQVSWEGDDPAFYPRSESKTWAQLSREARGGRFDVSEQQAASFLGFTQHTWDVEAKRDAHDLAARGGAELPEDDLVEAVLADQFYAWQEEASKRITAQTPEIKRFEIYGYYHQAVQGNVSGLRPPPSEAEEQKKYDSWFRLMGMTRTNAMQKYIQAVKELPMPSGVPQNGTWKAPGSKR
jgi:acyl-CoA-binding protein